MSLVARRAGALGGTASIPGDKSGSHRALILGAMASGETLISGLADGVDVQATIVALQGFGIDIRRDPDGDHRVIGGAWQTPDGPVDCGNSGTTARLLMGAVAGMAGVEARFIGDDSLTARPMRRIADPLRRMGAVVAGGDTMPLHVAGARLGGIEHRNLPASAQVKTALLLAGLGSGGPVSIFEPQPTRDHGEILLGQFGVSVDVRDEPNGQMVNLGADRQLTGSQITLGADPSSAAFPLVAALLRDGSDVTVKGMVVNPRRTGLYETLERMGADITLANERLVSGEVLADVTVRGSWLEPCHVTATEVPSMIDEIPVLAVACAAADGESVIEGLGELRHKESDRLGALMAGLTACGVAASVDGDALRIFGRGTVRGGRVMSFGDHRIAMAFLTLGLVSQQGVEVDGDDMIATSFPTFLDVMANLGADIA